MAVLTEKAKKKINLLKQKVGPIDYSSVTIDTQGRLNQTDLDKGIVSGYAIIWGERSLTGYKFVKGCCARSIAEHFTNKNAYYQIKFLNQHNPEDPLSLFAELEEDDLGLRFKTVPLDEWDIQGSSANRLIKQLKSKTINNFSHGFDWIWEKIEYDEKDDSIIGIEIQLFEISPVSIPAGLKTRQTQAAVNIEDVNEDIRGFIKTLPSKYRMQARDLFTRQHKLIDLGKPKETKTVKQKKTGSDIDYKYLTEHL